MGIDAQHRDYVANSPTWKKINDITRLQNLDLYLRELNPKDKSDANLTRNKQYRENAVFYAVAGQTTAGLLGTMFKEWPALSIPSQLEYLTTNCDGSGNSIYQQSQGLSDDVIRKSRAALVVSYPKVEGDVSQADILSGKAVATISRLEPEQVINWRTESVGSITRLSLVVVMEQKEVIGEDGYSSTFEDVIRELYLEEGVYKERVWEKDDDGLWSVVDSFVPTDASGKTWDEIPFTFVGAENNDVSVDKCNLLPLVELNIGHYRNSADYEDSVWYAGQVQPWMSGVDQNHIDLMKTNEMYVGSRTVLAVPTGETFAFAVAPPNPMVRQAMLDKEQAMLALGARLLQPGGAVKTASQVGSERETQHSVLSLIASNVSEAYTRCLQWVCRYMGVNPTKDLAFTINEEFVNPEATPQELQQVMQGFLQGTMPMSDYVAWMQKNGYFDEEKTTDEYAELLPLPGVGAVLGGMNGNGTEEAP